MVRTHLIPDFNHLGNAFQSSWNKFNCESLTHKRKKTNRLSKMWDFEVLGYGGKIVK